MSTPFNDLRAIAAKRRDKAFELARKEYDEAIQDIAALERKLVLRSPVKRKRNRQTQSLIDVIVSVVPTDRPFGLDDVVGWVREAESERSFTKPTVRTTINRLIKEGALKRVQRACGDRRALYAVPTLDFPECEPSLIKKAEAILRGAGKPMSTTEIVVSMLERGDVMENGPQRTQKSLQSGFMKNGHLFERMADSRWFCK